VSGHFLDRLVRLVAPQRLAERPVHGQRRRPANQEQRQHDQHGGGRADGGGESGGDELHGSGGRVSGASTREERTYELRLKNIKL